MLLYFVGSERLEMKNNNLPEYYFIFLFLAHLLPGIFLILVGYAECSLYLANIFLFFALGFNGAASIANLSNNQDISPNFAGFLYGIMNTVGSVSSVIIPTMVEEIAGKYGVSLLI